MKNIGYLWLKDDNRKPKGEMYMRDVRTFLETFIPRRKAKKTMLHPGDHPNYRKTAISKRAEFARDLLESEHYQEVIQFMNEEVIEEVAATEPLDTATLTVLKLRLQTISDFQFRLANFMDEYNQIQFEEYQEEQNRTSGDDLREVV